MTLYSKNGQHPKPLPHRIFLSNGMSRTDNTTFTPEEIADAGYVLAPDKPTVQPWQALRWNNNQWIVEDQNVESLKYQKVEQINTYRDSKIYSQKSVELSTGKIVPVDVRPNKPDLQNISALVQKATLKIMRQETESIYFRGADDELYELTPEETVEMGENVINSIEMEYAASWAAKDQLKLLSDAQQVYQFAFEW